MFLTLKLVAIEAVLLVLNAAVTVALAVAYTYCLLLTRSSPFSIL